MAGGGVFVHFDNISGKKAEVYVDTEVHNSGKRTRTVAVETVLADAGDVPVKRISQQVKLQAGESKTVRQQFAVRNPKLWSPDSPYLYRIQSRVHRQMPVVVGVLVVPLDHEAVVGELQSLFEYPFLWFLLPVMRRIIKK